MTLFTNSTPLWVSISLLLCFLYPVYKISNLSRKAILKLTAEEQVKAAPIPRQISLFFLLFGIYVGILSFTGLFHVNTLPPRILVYTAIPLLLFYFIVVFRSNLFWKILEKASLEDLVGLHLFRFIGIYFILGWYYKILPTSFAFIAGFGDLFIATTAQWVIRKIKSSSNHYKKITLVWNILGFWDIVSVILSAIFATKLSMESNTPGIIEMTRFPFCFIPAFAPATIIFLHICIFKRLKMKNDSKRNL
jgi:uncharacterized membrane protein